MHDTYSGGIQLCTLHVFVLGTLSQVAFKRFCDQLPREVDHTLLRPVVRKIKENIWNSHSGSMTAQLFRSQPSP